MAFPKRRINNGNKDEAYLGWIPISRSIGRSPMVETSSYPGEIHSAFRGFDTARFLKKSSSGVFFRNAGVGVETSGRVDSSRVVEKVHAINSVSHGRSLLSFLESNREEINLDRRLTFSRIPGAISTADELQISTSQFKLITLHTMNISRSISGGTKDVLATFYPADKQYLPPPSCYPGESKGAERIHAAERGRE